MHSSLAIRFSFLAAAALLVLVVASVSTRSAEPEVAEAGPIPYLFGDIGCNDTVEGAREITTNDFLLTLAHVVNIQLQIALGPGCPNLGDTVYIDGVEKIWGDLNCDGFVDSRDGLMILIYLSAMDPETACTIVLGTAIALAFGISDIKAVDMTHTIPAVLGPPPGQTAVEHFRDIPVITTFSETKHNNGPQAADVLVNWFVDLGDDEAYFNWVARSDDDRCFYNGDEVPCMEGSPEDGDGYDNCADDADNDGDGDVDSEDDDCVDYIDEIEFIIHLEPSVQTVVSRSIVVECKEAGPFGYEVDTEQTPQDRFDPNVSNNDGFDTVPGQAGDPANCVITKQVPGVVGGPSSGDAGVRGPRPVPYEPAALPNTGGRP